MTRMNLRPDIARATFKWRARNWPEKVDESTDLQTSIARYERDGLDVFIASFPEPVPGILLREQQKNEGRPMSPCTFLSRVYPNEIYRGMGRTFCTPPTPYTM